MHKPNSYNFFVYQTTLHSFIKSKCKQTNKIQKDSRKKNWDSVWWVKTLEC